MTAFSDLVRPSVLATCFADVRRRSPTAGADGVTPDDYADQLDERLHRLSDALQAGTWRPGALVRLRLRKPSGGTRRLGIPTVEDRIVIELFKRSIVPLIEARQTTAAHAYRPGRSARTAVDAVVREIEQGAGWVAIADIREFFDSVRHSELLDGLKALGVDPRVLELLERLLTRHALRRGRGLTQGSALSPALSNLALLPLVRALLDAGHSLVRYCDNLCIPSTTEAAAQQALQALGSQARRLGLSLKRDESRVVEVRTGFVWLGFWLDAEGRRVSDAAIEALRQRLDAAGADLFGPALIERLRPIVRGWAQYFDAALPAGATLGRSDTAARLLLAEYHAASPAEPTSDEVTAEVEPEDLEAWVVVDAQRRTEIDDLLDEAERLAADGAYAGAEQAYDAAQQLVRSPGSAPGTGSSAVTWDDEAIDTYLGLFCAGQDRFERAPIRGTPGLRDFEDVERPPSPADARAHLASTSAMAIRPRLSDGTCTLAVIDIDGRGPASQAAVQAHARALGSVARSWGLQVLVESTGGRGMHLWIPIDGRVSADAVAASLALLAAEAGQPAEGVRVELLPAGSDAPDRHEQAMTLPLSSHVETGQPSRLAWADGPNVGASLDGIFGAQANDPASLLREID